MELEINHPTDPRCLIRIRVSAVLADRRDLLLVTLADTEVHRVNRHLAGSPRGKAQLSDLMEQIGHNRFQVRSPMAQTLVQVVSRPAPSFQQKLNQALRNPVKALHDPELASMITGILTSRKGKE